MLIILLKRLRLLVSFYYSFDCIIIAPFLARSKSHSEDRRPLLNGNPRDEDHPDQKYAKRFAGERNIK